MNQERLIERSSFYDWDSSNIKMPKTWFFRQLQ